MRDPLQGIIGRVAVGIYFLSYLLLNFLAETPGSYAKSVICGNGRKVALFLGGGLISLERFILLELL